MRGVLVLIFILCAACASVGADFESTPDFAAAPSSTGATAEFADAAFAGAGDAESLFWLLDSSREALEARSALFDAAEHTLDVQYFIWQDDPSGYYLLERLLAAADRGVRIRLIVDDLSASGRDREFYAMAEHANIEIRTFNPFRARRSLFQAMEFSTRFGTLNHRMHNKAIIADGRVGMIGGRNIGDRYFGIYDDFVQYDLDIMFAGEVTDAAIASFDEFWNASLSVPVRDYLKPGRMKLDLEGLRSFLSSNLREHESWFVSFEFDADMWLQRWPERALPGSGWFVYDTADIDSEAQYRIKQEIYDFIAASSEEILISMAYFIPDDDLMELLEDAVRRGIRVVLVTNSVQSNNHMLAHVAYKRSRKRVLSAGIELYELRPDAQLLAAQTLAPAEPEFLGLHTKSIVVDRQRALIGTANLDPRALDINTETAVFIEAETLASELRRQILESISPDNAWRLELSSGGQVCWQEPVEPRCSEPVRGPLQRVMQFLHVLLPLKDQA